MPLPSFPYAAAHIFAIENKLLSRDRVERMVEAHSPDEVLRVLSETEYAAGVSELAGPHDYEKLLSGEVGRVYDFFQLISPEPEITNLFFLKYDFHNLKVLLKSRYLGKEENEFLIETGGNLSLEVLKDAIKEGDYSGLPQYIQTALGEIEQAMETRVDPLKIAVILDRAMYGHIFYICDKKKDKFAKKYFLLQGDLINIRSFLRVRKIGEGFEFLKALLLPSNDLGENFFLEAMEEPIEHIVDKLKVKPYSNVVVRGVEDYIQTGSLSTYERMMDDYLLAFVREARWNPAGIEPIIGYLLAKENEIKIIRIIMVGKINKLSPHIIRERLRDAYV